MIYEGLADIFKERYRENVPLDTYTSFRTGGPAKALITVAGEDGFVAGITYAKKNGINHYVLGNCSNVLISDRGLDGAVFVLGRDFSRYAVHGETIDAQSGIFLSALARVALENSLSGLEFASGIPGTLGAAVAINAGAYGAQMSDVILETRYMDEDGSIRTLSNDDHCFKYRHSIFCGSDRYVLSAVLKLAKGDARDIDGLMRDLYGKRKEKQPLSMPSAGSVFKRPPGDYAGRLIQDAGLMGHNIGGAEVSRVHAGFIVNAGNATSKDIYQLIFYIQDEVFKKSGVMLETEIKILGNFDY